jgi:hypothetical protein
MVEWSNCCHSLHFVFHGGANVNREQDIKAALIQHVARVVDMTVYLACDRQCCDFYVQMGFSLLTVVGQLQV